jgi:hypothetical protein
MAGKADITGAFGTVKSEKSYVSSRLDVQSARNKLFDANSALQTALFNFNNVKPGDADYQKRADAARSAQAKVDAAKVEVARVESLAKADYNAEKRKIDAKKDKSEAETIDKRLEGLQTSLQRAKDSGQSTAVIDAQIRDLTDKKNKTGKYAPTKEDTGNVVDQTTTGGTTARDYATEIGNAGRFIFGKKGKDLQALSSLLKDAGYYKGPVTGTPNDALVVAYQQALQGNLTRTQNVGSEVPLSDFLAAKIQEVKEFGGAGGGPSITESRSISTPLEAASRVEDIFKTELGRMPTPEEVAKYSKKLIAREQKQSSNVRTVTKKVGGVTVTETTGGLDRNQFLQELVRKIPEYSQRKSESRSLTVQTLQGTANDNGVTLSPQQLDQYALDVENGKDIKVIQNQIRSLAGLGMPDNVKKLLAEGTDLSTIYSPYKRTMATVLELNPDAISLNDPTLRSAIGPNGEATLYDFQRQLRKDSRWQYTDNAREDVSTAALQVLRDFGFQG